MSKQKLFIGGLNWSTDVQGLRNHFKKHGTLADVKLVTDRSSGRSRGFGFVTFSNDYEAREAMMALHGTQLDGSIIKVNIAAPAGMQDARTGRQHKRRCLDDIFLSKYPQ